MNDYAQDLLEDQVKTNVFDPVLFTRMMRYVGPYKTRAVLGLLFMTISASLTIVVPVLISALVDFIMFAYKPKPGESPISAEGREPIYSTLGLDGFLRIEDLNQLDECCNTLAEVHIHKPYLVAFVTTWIRSKPHQVEAQKKNSEARAITILAAGLAEVLRYHFSSHMIIYNC